MAVFVSSSGTTHNRTLPACIAGDLLVVLVAQHGGASTAPTTPAGWTLALNQNSSNVSGALLFYKVAVSGDSGATVNFATNASTSYHTTIRKFAAGSYDSSHPVQVAGLTSFGTTQTFSTPALTSVLGSRYHEWGSLLCSNISDQTTGFPFTDDQSELHVSGLGQATAFARQNIEIDSQTGHTFSKTAAAAFTNWSSLTYCVAIPNYAGDGSGFVAVTGSVAGEHKTGGNGAGSVGITASGGGAHGIATAVTATLGIAGTADAKHGVAGNVAAQVDVVGDAAGNYHEVHDGEGYVDIGGDGAGAHGVAGSIGAELSIVGDAEGFTRAPIKLPVNSRPVTAKWGAAILTKAEIAAPFTVSMIEDIETRANWTDGAPLQAEQRTPWGVSAATDHESGAPWSVYQGEAQPQSRGPWVKGLVRDQQSRSPWSFFTAVAQPQRREVWVKGLVVDRQSRSPWGRYARDLDIERIVRYARGTPADWQQWIPWTKYSTQHSDWSAPIPIHTGPPEALYVVPIRSLYMVTNTTSLRRVEGDIAIPTYSMSINLEAGSWAWSFSATIPAGALDAVQPNEAGDPIELEAVVNGTAFRVFAERIQRDRTFKDARISISGRGKIAALDAPYSPEFAFGNSEDRTAQQLIGDVLSFNGVELGWDVTFSLTDWLVPAGVHSFKGTYIAAVNDIVGAAGGYILPHPSNMSFQVLAQYPTAPWSWGTLDPDYELPVDFVQREGVEWLDMPNYNRVYVSGVQAGVLCQVTRGGSAGDVLASMVTHPLITEAAAGRQRGLAVLGNTGRIANVSLRMPVTSDTNGIILPGSLVRYVDGDTTRLGMSRSVAVETGMPEVWQTIGVETHV